MWLRPVCDDKFPGLVASLFSWRCLAASTSSLLHTAMNLLTVSTHTSAFKPSLSSPPPYAKRPDVALDAIGPLFLLPTASSPYCTLKVSENDSLRQPPTAHSKESPRPQKFYRSQCRLNALTPGYLKGTVVRSHPMLWSLALCPDYTTQDSVVYVAEFGVVFLAKSPRTAPIQEGFDCLRLNHRVFRESVTVLIFCCVDTRSLTRCMLCRHSTTH